MNARFLADQAVRMNAREGEYLSPGVVERLRRAHIATWLFMQDESVLASAAQTAVEAIRILVEHENKERSS